DGQAHHVAADGDGPHPGGLRQPAGGDPAERAGRVEPDVRGPGLGHRPRLRRVSHRSSPNGNDAGSGAGAVGDRGGRPVGATSAPAADPTGRIEPGRVVVHGGGRWAPWGMPTVLALVQAWEAPRIRTGDGAMDAMVYQSPDERLAVRHVRIRGRNEAIGESLGRIARSRYRVAARDLLLPEGVAESRREWAVRHYPELAARGAGIARAFGLDPSDPGVDALGVGYNMQLPAPPRAAGCS